MADLPAPVTVTDMLLTALVLEFRALRAEMAAARHVEALAAPEPAPVRKGRTTTAEPRER